MRTRGLPGLPDLRTLLRNPVALLGGLTAAGTRLQRETAAVLAAIHALPRLVVALERLGPAGDALGKLAETTATLEALARDTRHLPQTEGQLHALHEQVVAVACDLRALEPEIEQLAETAASLDRSIQVLSRAFSPLQSSVLQDGARDDRRATTRKTSQAAPRATKRR
jgi:hypothetical protein